VGSIPTRSRQSALRIALVLVLLSLLATGSADAARAKADVDSTSVGRARGFQAPFWVMMRSAAVPGWGQLHNGRILKAIVFGGAELGFGYGVWKEDQLAKDAKRQGDYLSADGHWSAKRDYLWWGAFTVLLSLGDAYVDAHLHGFDVEFRDEDSAVLLRYEVTP
jgi:hypothetical protein